MVPSAITTKLLSGHFKPEMTSDAQKKIVYRGHGNDLNEHAMRLVNDHAPAQYAFRLLPSRATRSALGLFPKCPALFY